MSKRNAPTESGKGKFDTTSLIRNVLALEDHWVLMLLLFAFGLMAAVVAYVFARPTYTSSAVVRAYRYVDTTSAAMDPGKGGGGMPLRAIGGSLETPVMILAAGKEIGLADEKTTYRSFRDYVVPKVRVSYLDGDSMEISIEAFSIKAVEMLPAALIDAFEASQARMRVEMREKAIQKYMDELAVMRERVVGQMDTRLKFEENSNIATTQVELEELSDVPIKIVRLRHQVKQMEITRQILEKRGDSLGTIGKLSLLAAQSGEQEQSVSTGKLVRGSASGPVTFQNPAPATRTEIVVQPSMIEGLQPWQELEKSQRSLEEQMRMSRLKYGDEHQEIKRLKEELQKIGPAMELELTIALNAFDLELEHVRSQLASYEAKLPEYHKAVKDFDEKRVSFDLMQRGQLAWDHAYEKLAKQIEGLELGEMVSPIKLELKGFTEMRNEIPVSPSKSKLLTIGLLLGLGSAVGIPFLLRQVDSSVNSLEEFSQYLGLKGIGLVPHTDEKVLNELNRSPAIGATVPNALLENFRLIRSSVILNPGTSGDEKVIMVTSARPGEGKSTVAANTAWAFASIGEKTLVIDCDLRRGRVAAITGVDNQQGMTTLLMGQCKLTDCLKKSSAEGLWIIPRGPIIQGTTELLSTPAFKEILADLKKDFARIILDTPPVLGLSETAFLQNHAAGIVLVVRAQKTPRKDVIEAVDTLRKLDAYFYGFVLNDVDFSKRLNSYQYYYYSSNYYDLNWEEEGDDKVATRKKEKTSLPFSDKS